jgi:hypothetical protein
MDYTHNTNIRVHRPANRWFGRSCGTFQVELITSGMCPITWVQLLNFYKMAFYLFSVCSVLAALILMPINLKV